MKPSRPRRPGPDLPALPLLAALIALAACGGRRTTDAGVEGEARLHGLTAEQSREVLARVGDRTITLGDFAARLAEQSPYLRARYNSPERRRELLDDMIRFELLVQEAKRLGLDRDPAVRRIETQALVDELLRTDVDPRLSRESISDADARAFYDAHTAEWNQPPQVRASHLRFGDRAAANRALTALRAASGDPELFRRLAREQSNDAATKESGGDLRFFSRPTPGTVVPGEPPASVAEAAFALAEPGDLAPQVVASPDGFHVVQLTARREAMARGFDEVKPMIVDRLLRERREAAIRELVTRLRREGHVEEDPSVLGSIRIDVAAPAPRESEEGE